MIPILYEKGETNFTHNGIGFLSDAIKAVVTEERNGSYELSLQYPISGQFYDQIADGSIIKAKANETSALQLFRIYKSSKPLNGIVTYAAEHISYDLNGIPTLGISLQHATAQMAMQEAVNNAAFPCQFSVLSDISTLADIEILTPCSLRAVLGGGKGSVLDVWGGEFEFDNFTVKLHEHRGENNGITIAYGKNLTDLNQESNISECYTHLLPYAVCKTETANGEGEEKYIYLSEGVIPLAKAEKIGHYKAYIMNFSDHFEDAATITESMLREAATAYASTSTLGIPKVSITVSFIQLWQTEDYKNIAPLERVKLCDTVTVLFPALGVQATAKVIKTVYDTLKEKYESVALGEAKSTLADTLKNQNSEIENIKESIKTGQSQAAEALKKAILNATNLITGHSGGYVVLNPAEKPQEILILDAPTIEEAVKVWRWNSGGLGYSSTGYNGTFALAMTMDGAIVADFITAGTFNGALLKADSVEAAAISARYKQEVTDQIGNVEKTVTQAFKVADEQLLSTITIALADYATTEEMSSAITQTAEEIALTVTAARTYAETLAAGAESAANSYTDRQLQGYATTEVLTSEILQLADKISLVVTSSTSGGDVINSASIIAAINGDSSSVTINASKINLTAYAKTSEVYDTAYDAAESAAEDAISGLSLTASNGSTSSTVYIKHNGVTVDSATVRFTGIVTFSDLSTEGATVINGSNITTGTISADLIAANNDIYIEFAHPMLTSEIFGLQAIYMGEYAYIYKEDYDAGTTSMLCIYAYSGVKFMYQTPVVYEYVNGRYQESEIITESNIEDYMPSTVTAVFG